VAAAREGSFSALGQLLEHYRDYLLRIAHNQVRPDLGIKFSQSDLVQQTFLSAVQLFPRFAGHTDGELRAWLRQILLNELRDAHKLYRGTQKRATDRERPLYADEVGRPLADGVACPLPLPNATAAAAEAREKVRRAIERLSAADQTVLRLRTVEGREFDEVGTLMNRSGEAVRRLWSRAVQRLSQHLSEYDDD
jgi:RNA polymerase sigma-70 factor (ECF subfamily)